MEYKLIPLSIGKYKNLPPKSFAKVDPEDFEDISKYNWTFCGQGYATRIFKVNGLSKHEKMHRRILKCTESEMCDHINGDRVDNRKCNLRYANKTTNGQNSSKRKTWRGRPCSSEFKGVYFLHGKWQSEIGVNKKKIRLGRFTDEIDAALVYNDAAKFYFGEFARINDIPFEKYKL